MWYIGGLPVVERNHAMVATLFFFTTLAFLLVCLRMITRTMLVRNVGVDDGLMVAATIGSVIYLSAVFQQIRFGLGNAVIPEALEHFLISLYATVIAYNYTQLAVKFSILTQYKRIFETESAARLFNGLLIYLGCYAAFCLGSSIFTCVPIAKYWHAALPGGCLNRSNLHYGIAGVNIFNDFILLCIPYPFLRRLNITRRAKYILIGVFACGGVACIVAIIRLHSLVVNNSAPIDQQPIQGVDIALWSGLEINIAISCASVPQLKAMFVRVIPKLTSYYSSSNHATYGTGVSGAHHGGGGDGGDVGDGNAHYHHRHYPSQNFRNGDGGASTDREDIDSQEDGGGLPGKGSTSGSGGGGGGGILVERAFEMQSMPIPDNSSEQNLVMNSWNAGCYAAQGGDGQSTTGVRSGSPV